MTSEKIKLQPYTILIPHYKTGKLTAHAVYRTLLHSQNNDISIVVIDNSDGIGMEYLEPFKGNRKLKIVKYPTDLLQSHGVAFDYAIDNGYVDTDYFICMESDSYPISDNWLLDYDRAIKEGCDMAGGIFNQSSGHFIHPTGALYSKQLYLECKEYVKGINKVYWYCPNHYKDLKSGLSYHSMLPKVDYPNIEQSDLMNEITRYMPVATSVFHNGMGFSNDDEFYYWNRTKQNQSDSMSKYNVYDSPKTYVRIGFEPGQYLHYWAYANNKKIIEMPVEIIWMKHRTNQQQAYSIQNGRFKHEWCGTAYSECKPEEHPHIKDILEYKQSMPDRLYANIPKEYQVN